MLLPPIIIMAHDYSHALNTINACWVYHVESVSKIGLVLRLPFCNIWGCMCWAGPFEFRWLKGYIYNPSYYHHQIGSIHLSHCCHIFPWLCVWNGCTTIFCHLLHIYREDWDLVSIICVQSIEVQSMVFANDRIHYGLQVVFVCLQITPSHYHCAGNSPGPVNSPHKGPVTRKMFPFDDVIMYIPKRDHKDEM